MAAFEPTSIPRTRYEIDDETGECIRVINLDSGQQWEGLFAQDKWAAKKLRDEYAGILWGVIRSILPDVEELRADHDTTVVFGLPAELADEYGEALAAAAQAVLYDAMSMGRVAVVWS